MYKKFLFLGILLIPVVLVSVFVVGNFWTTETTNGTNKLRPVEIREYEGQKLSSISDFRENSIKGTQSIDNEGYRLVVTGLVKPPGFKLKGLIPKY